MTSIARLRVLVVDDEPPARALVSDLVASFDDCVVVGEAKDGADAIAVIEAVPADLVLLDLEMPGLGGLDVVRMVPPDRLPLVAFVTAFDDYAVRAFEIEALDYVLKPVSRARLRQTLQRAIERLDEGDWREQQQNQIRRATAAIDHAAPRPYLERLPIRVREDIVLVPVEQIVSIVADGEVLNLTTLRNETYTVSYRLKDLEARLNPNRFVRLSRGTLAAVRAVARFSPMPGGTYVATLVNGQQLSVSRSQGRMLRDQLMRL